MEAARPLLTKFTSLLKWYQSVYVAPRGFSSPFLRTIAARGIRSLEGSVDRVDGESTQLVEDGPDVSKSSAGESSISRESDVKYTALSSLKTSTRHDLAMIFTCRVCETRSVKTVCRESYEKGVVLARCGGCNNLHLIADRLGWFGERGSIEDLMAARGEKVTKGSVDTLNLTLEDLAGAGVKSS